jgi:ADP-ribosylglycohydrolase
MRPLERAALSLHGLSVGDAFGERFFGPPDVVVPRMLAREVPLSPWRYTDDTEMALSIYEVLAELGVIDQDVLASRFAARMQDDRGYGVGAYEILSAIRLGGSWRNLSKNGFRGMGSFGNGAAMRVGPLGAYFADEPMQTVVDQATLSAEITHAHAEGIAGAVAVACASALAWTRRAEAGPLGRSWLEEVHAHVPKGYTRDGIEEALSLSSDVRVVDVAKALGNGSGVTAPDTVPLCLWVAAYHADFEDALWKTVSVLGDRDTTCAIVGAILALKVGETGIPRDWLDAREALPVHLP